MAEKHVNKVKSVSIPPPAGRLQLIMKPRLQVAVDEAQKSVSILAKPSSDAEVGFSDHHLIKRPTLKWKLVQLQQAESGPPPDTSALNLGKYD